MNYIISTKDVCTRKAHKCFGCNREFSAGTTMSRHVVHDDDNIFSAYLCSTCAVIETYVIGEDTTYEQGDLREEALKYEKNLSGGDN